MRLLSVVMGFVGSIQASAEERAILKRPQKKPEDSIPTLRGLLRTDLPESEWKDANIAKFVSRINVGSVVPGGFHEEILEAMKLKSSAKIDVVQVFSENDH